MTGEQFKRKRERMGLSQEALAETFGVRQATISDWERGVNDIPVMAALALEAVAARRKSKKR